MDWKTVILILLLVAAVGAAYYYLRPTRKPAFNPQSKRLTKN